jgi:hypothetical protein
MSLTFLGGSQTFQCGISGAHVLLKLRYSGKGFTAGFSLYPKKLKKGPQNKQESTNEIGHHVSLIVHGKRSNDGQSYMCVWKLLLSALHSHALNCQYCKVS